MENKHWYRSYFYIWTGQFISLITSAAVNFSVIIWLSLHYKSAEVLAFAAIAGLLPQALIGPFAGVFIDRWDRKKVMIFADAFIALCTLLMTFVLDDGGGQLLLIYLLLGCRSVGSAFHAPAMQAIAPLLVPEKELLRVSGVNQMLQSISSIGGPALGTLAISYFPITQVLYLDIIGALAAICSLFFISIPYVAPQTKASISGVWDDLKLGIQAIFQHQGIKQLFLYAMVVTFFVMPVAIMFPLLTIEHYGGAKWEMSVVEIAWGVGMLVGGSLLGILRMPIAKIVLINSMYIILGLTFALSGLFAPSWFIPFVFVTAVGGISMSIFSAAFMTIIQEEIPQHMLGRVFSLYFSIAILPSIIGLLFTGLVAEAIGITTAFVISGIFVCLVGILSFYTAAMMRLGRK